MSYMFCVDLDGPGAMPLGPTGLQIFGTFVTGVAPFTIDAAVQQMLSFSCQSLCSSFLVHLAESCEAFGLLPAEVPGEPSKTFAFQATSSATVDTSALRPGRSYEICVDHGYGAGRSGLRIYVAGAGHVQPAQIQAATVPRQRLNKPFNKPFEQTF